MIRFAKRTRLRLLLPILWCLLGSIATYGQAYEYWFVAPNIDPVNYYQTYDCDSPTRIVLTAGDNPANVTVYYKGGDKQISVTLTAGESKLVTFAKYPASGEYALSDIENQPANRITPSFTKNKFGIHITSDNLIFASYMADGACLKDIFTLKGKSALGKEFFVTFQNKYELGYQGYPDSRRSFHIVATEDNTNITIQLKHGLLVGCGSNTTINISLNAGETWAAEGMDYTQELYGTKVTADKDIAITVYEGIFNGDMIGDQIVPTNQLAKSYVIIRTYDAGRTINADEYAFIFATKANTTLTIIGANSGTSTPVTLLNEGDMHPLLVTSEYYTVESSEPVYVYQLSARLLYPNRESGASLLPSIYSIQSKALSFYKTNFSTANALEHYIFIVTHKDNINNFLANGATGKIPASSFIAFRPETGLEDWRYARINITSWPTGITSIRNTKGAFSLGYMYGDATCGAYGYLSGFGDFSFPEITYKCVGETLVLDAGYAKSYRWWKGEAADSTNTILGTNRNYTIPANESGYYSVEVNQDPLLAIATTLVKDDTLNLVTNVPELVKVNTSTNLSATVSRLEGKTFSWQLGTGASPSTSTLQAPTGIVWNSLGRKTVSLTVNYTDLSCGAEVKNHSVLVYDILDDHCQTVAGIPVLVDVLANDNFGDCTPLGIQIATQGSKGLAVVEGGKIRYTPSAGVFVKDSLTYTVNCGSSTSLPAKVYIYYADLPDNISDAECFVPNAGSVWGIRQADTLGEVSTYFPPLIGDLDGDQKPEIVVPSKHGTVLTTLSGLSNPHQLQYISVFKGTDRSRIEFSTKMPFFPLGAGMVAIAKIQIGGIDTGIIVVAEADLFLRAYNMSGDLLWTSDTKWSSYTSTYPSRTSTSILISDINGDGTAEIITGSRIYNATNGKLLSKGNENFGFLGYNEPTLGFFESSMTAVGDILGDSRLEVIAGSEIYEVSYTLNTMTPLLKLDTIICAEDPSLKVPKDGFTQLIDIDNDGNLEVLVQCRITTSKHFMYIWSPLKKRVLSQKLFLNTDKIGVPFIGDVDGDKKPEILLIGANTNFTPANNFIYAFKYKQDSTLFSNFWTLGHTDDSGVTGLTLFDFNQDGISEIVYRDQSQLRIINGSKKSHITHNDTTKVYNLANFNCTSGTGYEYPTIADIDGDGATEILIAGGTGATTPVNGQLQVFKSQAGTSWAPARKVWNQYAYNAVHVNNDLSIPRSQLKISTVFPGPDSQIGTPDDVRPYNAFLQQQTNLNKFGTSLFTTPNYVLLEGWTSKDLSGDSVSITFCVTNLGDENGTPPLYVSAYKNSRTSTNLLATNSYPTIPAIGDTLCYTLSIKNFSTLGNNAIVLSVNDKGTGTLVIPECDSTDGYQSKTPLFAKKDYASCFVACELAIPILSNDKLGSCIPASVQLDTLTGSGLKKGSLIINADKSFLYTPVIGAKGIDSVSYYLKCGKDSSATTVYILIHDPLSAETCPSVSTTVGFNPQTDVLYTWYTQQTGGTAIATGNPSNALTVLKGSALDIGTIWVQPSYKGVIFPRIRISLTF